MSEGDSQDPPKMGGETGDAAGGSGAAPETPEAGGGASGGGRSAASPSGPPGNDPPGQDPKPPPDAPPPPPPPPEEAECVNPEQSGDSPIRRVSTEEYSNAVNQVLGAVINPGQLPADEKLGTFLSNITTRVTSGHFERYRAVARTVAADVVTRFAELSGCASAADAACVEGFLLGGARRLFHGTLLPADAARIQDLYAEVTTAAGAELALDAAVQWMLLSPRFLFLVELGQTGSADRNPLTPSEVAGRLAAFLWRSVPDEALLEAADSGALSAPEGVKAEADAMLKDPRAVAVLRSFGSQWLRIVPADPDASTLERQKRSQVAEVLGGALSNAALSYQDLLLGDFQPEGGELAAFYGAEDRRGVLLTGAFLASNASGDLPSPVKRGYVIRTALLCDDVPLPTDPTDMDLADDGTGVDVFQQHSAVPQCWGCHRMMDPLGDAFSQYDFDGSFNPALSTKTSGALRPDAADPGEFDDVAGLLALLSEEPKALSCFAKKMTRFAVGRNETAEDACAMEDILRGFESGSYSVRRLLVEVAGSSLFLGRDPVVAGGQCR